MKYAVWFALGTLIASGVIDTLPANASDKCDNLTGRARSRCLMKERRDKADDDAQKGSPSRSSTASSSAPPAPAPVVSRPSMPRSAAPGASASPGTVVTGSRATISWSTVSGATEYDFGIRDMTSNQLLVDTQTKGTSYTARIEKGRVYRWNVRACNSAGCSAFTTPLYFQTEASVAINGNAPSSISAISLPASFPLYNQHNPREARLYFSESWAREEDPAGGPRTDYTCLATVYAMIEHARGNTRFRIGPDTWNNDKGANGIAGIGIEGPIGTSNDLIREFRNGNPVILWGPLKGNSFGHYVLAIGTNSAGQIIVLDPSSGNRGTVNPGTLQVSGGSILSEVKRFRTVRF